jgi:hypothetical protein
MFTSELWAENTNPSIEEFGFPFEILDEDKSTDLEKKA